MGLCQPKNKKINLTTRGILSDRNFPDIEFYFTHEKLNQLEGQCLVLFINKRLNLKKNNFLKRVGLNEANKINQFYQAQLNGNQLNYGEFIIYKNSVGQLKYNYIAVICLSNWASKKQPNSLSDYLGKLIDKLSEKEIKSVIFTEIGSSVGYPSNVGSKSLLNQLYEKQEYIKDKIKKITIVFEQQQSEEVYLAALKEFKPKNLDISNSVQTGYY